MEPGALKPLLGSLALPPLSLLLLAFLGLLLAALKRRGGIALVTLSLALLWLLSCHGASVWLARHALPQFPALTVAQLRESKAQAIVVLGGGLLPQAPEYGQPQPSAPTASRLRYGLWLGRQSGLPLAFTGGIGWAGMGASQTSEADVAARMAQDYGVTVRWLEARSRDTVENANLLAPLLKRDGVQRIALVTDARHMPRAMHAFRLAGLDAIAAPANFILPEQSPLMEWLPTAYGLQNSQQVLREWLALLIFRLSH